MQSKGLTVNIPLEIWHNCWQDLPRREFLALSLTCKLFHDICRPRIFEYLLYLPTTALLDEHITDEDYKKWEESAAHFGGKLKWLASSPVTARYPRYLMFSGIPDEDLVHFGLQHQNATNAYHSLLSTFKESVGSFANLRQLRLEDINVDQEIIHSIQKFPLLKQLYCQSVNLSCNTSSPLIQLTELSILEWEPQTQITPQHLELFSNRRLNFVEIQSFQYALPCLQHFTLQGTSEALTTLRIVLDVGIIPTLFAFLETCPHLTTLGALVIDRPGDFHPTYPTLSPSALPDLRFYEGVASLAAVLIPGRPVHSVMLKDVWEGGINDPRASSICHNIAKSSAVIRGIALPRLTPHPDIFHVVSKKFPKLETLQLNFAMTEADLLEFKDEGSIPDAEYFDVTTPTEIRSIPVDENGCPVRLPTSMKGVLYWLCLNKLPLPPTIIKLAIVQNNNLRGFERLYRTCLSYREQYQTLEMLSSHSRNLKAVVFGGHHVQWVVGQDDKWKPGRDFEFYVENREHWTTGRRAHVAEAQAGA